MANNASLHAAGVAKQDEFYTQYEDIQNELNHYEKHFRGDRKSTRLNSSH